MARRITEDEIGEQLAKQKQWMRANAHREVKAPVSNMFGLAFIMVGIFGTIVLVTLGEYAASGLGVALIGIGTTLINR